MIYFSLFTVSLISGFLAFLERERVMKVIPSILSFSAAYLLSICFLHLLPELFTDPIDVKLSFFLLLGFFLQLILDYFSGGIEHGHTHYDKRQVGKFPFVVFLSLSIHAFAETLPLVEMVDEAGIRSYLWSLLVHKAPISFVLIFLLLRYQLKKVLILISLLLFSSWGPLGAYFGSHFNVSESYFQYFFALSIGIILHLSTTILIESNEQHQIKWKKLLPLLAGILLAISSLIFH